MHLHNWYNHLSQEGKKYGYLGNGSKSWLLVKSDILVHEAKRVFGDDVNNTSEGQHHLGAVIGSQEVKDQYCWKKVLGWKRELEALSQIARSQSHAAYIVFTTANHQLLSFSFLLVQKYGMASPLNFMS